MTNSDLFIVDSDSHWSEPADLFTKRAPAEFRDRVPRVETIDGQQMWVFDGKPVGNYSAGGVIGRDGKKESAEKALFEWTIDEIHVGAYDPKVRLQVLDECGIDAQIIFPSTIGLGGQGLGLADDASLTRLSIEIYNDAMAEIQSESGNRLLPLPLMPAWDIDLCVSEAKRVAALGARGVNMTSDPQDLGSPDLANRAWDPFWETCTELRLPVHFHIGASITGMTFYGKYPWESHGPNTKLAIGGTLLFIGNARVVTNLILSGIFDRHPDLQTVSVESGVGWIPFILEALDYEMAENAPAELAQLKKMPSDYFRSNIYATFWFENNRNRLPDLIEAVGEDRILFETDFPHPTCLYPDPLQSVETKMATLSHDARAKILGENARKLYRL
ncbi:amidohydrolase family protein [Parafrankia sp. EUN1f]|uniref:amidohydrolase family protein n=1 Tax=Parafrankia sp. EUN1f TaxID=102897 RepID=UPI0001C45128|nr:amidohydrolase family protein [Parafrankia sp. EUN1f]EFC84998.1 amidohydrolase 2 [Parafrankia sp. EUN1f]